jgi:hypothetical protein
MAEEVKVKKVRWYDKPDWKRKRRDAAIVLKTAVLCVAVAGVIVLVQSVDKSAEKRGQLEGYTKAATTIQSLCK